jgi:hypothetical protein
MDLAKGNLADLAKLTNLEKKADEIFAKLFPDFSCSIEKKEKLYVHFTYYEVKKGTMVYELIKLANGKLYVTFDPFESLPRFNEIDWIGLKYVKRAEEFLIFSEAVSDLFNDHLQCNTHAS